jgi:hypothetical protein
MGCPYIGPFVAAKGCGWVDRSRAMGAQRVWEGVCEIVCEGVCERVWEGVCERVWEGVCERVWEGVCEGVWEGVCEGVWEGMQAREREASSPGWNRA